MTTAELMATTDAATGALAVVERGSGVMPLAVMSDADFESRLAAMKLGQERVRRIQRELMVGPTEGNPEGEDFGIIPGTKKPTLLKPGAEKICQVYGLVPTFEETVTRGDGATEPHIRVLMRCFLHRGSKDGPIVGEGIGSANSFEKKHRYRAAQRSCPRCGVEGSIRRSSFEDRDTGDRGYYCNQKAGGCNAKFSSDDPAITDQQGGQVDNPDPWDAENTLLKMAAKRAQVDAVLRTTATSALFTQDQEDNQPEDGSRREPQRQEARPEPRPPAQEPRREPPRQAPQATGSGRTQSTATLAKWDKPCPRCKVTGAVMVSKKKAGSYYCYPDSTRAKAPDGSSAKGCGYTFTPEDAAIQAGARESRNTGDLQEYGVEDAE